VVPSLSTCANRRRRKLQGPTQDGRRYAWVRSKLSGVDDPCHRWSSVDMALNGAEGARRLSNLGPWTCSAVVGCILARPAFLKLFLAVAIAGSELVSLRSWWVVVLWYVGCRSKQRQQLVR
jgi:hypothetical protein